MQSSRSTKVALSSNTFFGLQIRQDTTNGFDGIITFSVEVKVQNDTHEVTPGLPILWPHQLNLLACCDALLLQSIADVLGCNT